MKLKSIYDEYMDLKRTHCSDKTLQGYQENLKFFLDYVVKCTGKSFDIIDLEVVTSDLIRNYIIYLRNRKCFENHPHIPESSKKISNTTILSYCRPLKAFLRYCIQEDYLPNVLKNVKFPSSDPLPKLPLYREEVKCIDGCFDIQKPLGLRNYCMFHLMLDCGLRSGEVVRLKKSQIYFDRNLMLIYKSKYNKSRYVLLPDFLAVKLQQYFSMTGYDSFRNRNGTLVSMNTVKMFFQGIKESSGVDRVHPHLLRHTFGTSFIIGGGDIEILRVLMGHSDYDTTKIYISMAAEMRILHADIYRLDDIFFQKGY